MSNEPERGGYFFRVSIGLDQFINTIFGGDPDETISAKWHRKKDSSVFWNIARIVVNKIFFWQNNHCHGAYMTMMKGGYKSNHYNKLKCK